MRIVIRGLLATVVLSACASSPAGDERHVIYLHGRIVQEQQSVRPQSPDYGYYELEGIREAFRSRGFTLHSEIRPKGVTVSDAADHVVKQVRALIDSGVRPDHITVVGASMGASIAMRVSARLQQPDVRFALLGPCLSSAVPAVTAEEKKNPAGRMLVVRDLSDVPLAGCDRWAQQDGGPTGLRAREIEINTGLAHGYLYRPLPEWVDPAVEWARATR